MSNIQFDEKIYKQLTPREIQIVQAAANGCGIKQTAADLGLTKATVQNHRSRAIWKLRRGEQKCRNITHAVTILRASGIIE